MFIKMARTYRKTRRQAQEAETRQRIVDAAIALHQKKGPRHSTISAIADRAGVQRLTVYRHFPDEVRLFEACTGCWLERNPLPDPQTWLDVEDPVMRCRKALDALYAYYSRTSAMWRVTYRDADEVPALEKPMAAVNAYFAEVVNSLSEGFPSSPAVAASLAHAVAFSTWYSLDAQQLGVNESASLATLWVAASAGYAG